jgi:serine protease AprX
MHYSERKAPEVRGNGLWGSKGGSGTRANGLWGGRGSKSVVLLATLVSVSLISVSAPTAGARSTKPGHSGPQVPASLLAAAQANPQQIFHVIVQETRGHSSHAAGQDVASENGKTKRSFHSIAGVSADISGKDLLKLARHPNVLSITPDAPLALATAGDYQDAEMWRESTGIASLWTAAPQAPAIAIVDSGIDASKAADFGSRVVASVNLSSLDPNATGDSDGHGTMVAGIAAGASSSEPGVAQNAPLVDVHTANGQGQSMTSDVVAACDWILAHKAEFDIRVANFSMVAPQPTTFQYDPLDRAVESLWLNGIVVTAAAGNQRTDSSPVDMSGAPGNDPFIITVGAADQNQTSLTSDDTIAPWSAYGHTADGFQKPELSAPGRYLIMPVPPASTIAAQLPDRVVSPGYMWMSGTSFAAPVVAGAAAQLLARHPAWTPGQIKGALMLTARPLPAPTLAGGVGEVDAAAAAALASPINADENLDAFVVTDPATGARAFDYAAWERAVSSSASWTSASWTSASWTSASWTSASWTSASWTSASWTTASWTSADWASASWTSGTHTGSTLVQ